MWCLARMSHVGVLLSRLISSTQNPRSKAAKASHKLRNKKAALDGAVRGHISVRLRVLKRKMSIMSFLFAKKVLCDCSFQHGSYNVPTSLACRSEEDDGWLRRHGRVHHPLRLDHWSAGMLPAAWPHAICSWATLPHGRYCGSLFSSSFQHWGGRTFRLVGHSGFEKLTRWGNVMVTHLLEENKMYHGICWKCVN